MRLTPRASVSVSLLSLSLSTSLLLAGCSSGTSAATQDAGAGADGGGLPATAVPQVTFESQVSPGTHSAKECPQSGTWFTMGSFGNPAAGLVDPNDPASGLKEPVKPVANGTPDQQGTATVSCSVAKDGAGFQVKAHAELTGANGGAVTITGQLTGSGDQPGITLALTRRGETFTSQSCTARMDPVLGQAVASGRVWATVDCPDATNAAAQQTCASRAELRFENCTQ